MYINGIAQDLPEQFLRHYSTTPVYTNKDFVEHWSLSNCSGSS
jgi:hypothetical protein